MNRRSLVLTGLISLLLLAGTGCATKIKPLYTIWPPPPNEPRIVFLQTFYGREDVKGETFIDLLLGKQTIYDITKPYGVFADRDRLYVTETNPPPILVVLDRKKGKSRFIMGEDFGGFRAPIGVAAASNGTIYVSDAVLGGVYVFDKKGDHLFTIGKKGTFKKPAGLALDEKLDRIYIADAKADNVQAYSLSGEPLFVIGGPGAAPGLFHAPTNIAVDRRNGNIVVVDTFNFRVQVFDKEGTFLRTFGELGDNQGQFSRPKGVGVDSEGNIYVVDSAFDNIQVFNEKGKMLSFFGSAGSDPGFFFGLPSGMYIDENDRIYISDQLNRRVQVFQYLSDAWKKANPQELERYQKLQIEESGKIASQRVSQKKESEE